MSSPLWFKDAVIYEVPVKSFYDSNGDGVGDFRGLIEKIDYFAELGVTAIWILPFYPSPLRDDGYDISDYASVNPAYGTMEDFREFLEAAHARGLRVITELVINHTSDQHPWFQAARRAPVGSPLRDFYVWSDTPLKYTEARIIFKDFEPSNWSWDPLAKAYYWHRFFHHQPDLNFDNPAVHDAVFRLLDLWLGMGVDGLRLDAVPYLYEREGTNCENLPETHAFLKKLRKHVDGKFPGRMLLAEANQWPEDAAAYFGDGDECHMNFHFPIMPRLFMSLQMEDRFPIVDILDQTPAIPAGCQWATFLRNHDELTLEMVTDEERDYMYRVYADDPRARINLGIRRRLAPLMRNNRRRIELINALLFSLPGTPIVYYGDEIGMGDNFYLGDRNGVRTPMQWAPDRNGGFSTANPQQLYLPSIIDPEYHFDAVNVENQKRNGSSLFWWMRRLIAERKRWSAFGNGTIEFLHPRNAKILAFIREHGDEAVLMVANLSRFTQAAELNLSAYNGVVPMEIFSRTKFPEIRAGGTMFTLGPHDFYWIALKRPGKTMRLDGAAFVPVMEEVAAWNGKLSVPLKELLEKELLPAYLGNCRWFPGKARELRELKITEDIAIRPERTQARLLFVLAAFAEGFAETFVIPIQHASGERAARLLEETPQAVFGRFTGGNEEDVLFDASYDSTFRAALFEAVMLGTKERHLHTTQTQSISAEEVAQLGAASQVVDAVGTNITFEYGGVYFLKLYRRFEWGRQPEEDLLRYLTEEHQFPHTPAYHGALYYGSGQAGKPATLAVLTQFVQNQGDAWYYTVDSVVRFFERVIASRPEITSPEAVLDAIGAIYPERVRNIGQRIGELHLALVRPTEDPSLSPEPFTTLYQRSLYQGVRGQVLRIIRLLEQAHSELDPELQELAGEIIKGESALLERCAALLRRKVEAEKIAIHGALHLGQVLNTGKDVVLTDLEGDPSRPLSERSLKRSPLVDVARMIRSIDYAANAALYRQQAEDIAFLTPWVKAWTDHISSQFLSAYVDAAGSGNFLPKTMEDIQLLLDLFLMERASAEVARELADNPPMASIPMRAMCEMTR